MGSSGRKTEVYESPHTTTDSRRRRVKGRYSDENKSRTCSPTPGSVLLRYAGSGLVGSLTSFAQSQAGTGEPRTSVIGPAFYLASRQLRAFQGYGAGPPRDFRLLFPFILRRWRSSIWSHLPRAWYMLVAKASPMRLLVAGGRQVASMGAANG